MRQTKDGRTVLQQARFPCNKHDSLWIKVEQFPMRCRYLVEGRPGMTCRVPLELTVSNIGAFRAIAD